MKQKRLISAVTLIAMLLALLPNFTVSAEEDTMRYKRVTSADEITSDAKYIIVGCPGGYEKDTAEYYAMEYTSENSQSGYRPAFSLVSNDDGTLSLASSTDPALTLTLSPYNSGYRFKTADGKYLNGAYATGSKTYAYDASSSRSLPLVDGSACHFSTWQLTFRDDGTVLFKTSRTSGYVTTSAYIRMHHQANNGGAPVFSGGFIDDGYFDFPEDGSLTYDTVTEENAPVKTYLYREVCAHSEENLTHTAAKSSTCSEQGNIEYYYCSNCGTYLTADKATEISLEDTVLPLVPHSNTTFVPAKEPTCTESGNIAYTYCADCGGYFESDAAQTPIDVNDTALIALNHSYTDGVCSICGKTAENAYFDISGTTGNGHRYIFAAEYDGKFYAMGNKSENGMQASEVTQTADGILFAGSDTAAFAEKVSYGEMIEVEGSYSSYYTPIYIKIGGNYLKNNSLALTIAPSKDTATYWRTDWEYDADGNCGIVLSDNKNGDAQLCLVTDDGEPYFSMCEATDNTHIAAYMYGELCSHPDGLSHTEEVLPTCITDGHREYWYCDVCERFFSDEQGVNSVNETDLPLPAAGAEDADDDGICDLCGKPMPAYIKVTDNNEIVMGGRYILVTEMDGSLYTMKTPDADEYGYYYDLGTEMPAERITAEEDGSVKFNSAAKKKALSMRLDFACECSDLDKGTVRYALRTAASNKAFNLESYGGFCLVDKAKYGWRIALNEDGSAKMSDVYDESIEDWNSGSGKLCAYRVTENDGSTRVILSVSDEADHKTENTATITKHPVYLYRLTEQGTINDVSYRLSDASSTVTQSAEIPAVSESAAAVSNVSGVSQALTQAAIEEIVTQSELSDSVSMSVDVNITASEYTAPNEETGTGGSITFILNPTVNVTMSDGESEIIYDIPDSALDGSPITVTLYTYGIEPQQIVHIKEDGTREYFYPEDSVEVVQNGEKSFTQAWDNNSNMYVTFTITEFSEIQLLETPEVPPVYEFSVSDYDAAAGTVNVSCAAAGEYALIFADYENGALNSAKIMVQSFKAGTVTAVEVPKEISLSPDDKIFLWNDINAIHPLCEAYTVK